MAHPMSLWFFFFLLRKLKFSSPGQLPNRFPLLPAVAKIVSHGCSSGKETGKKERVYGVSQPTDYEDKSVEGLWKKLLQ